MVVFLDSLLLLFLLIHLLVPMLDVCLFTCLIFVIVTTGCLPDWFACLFPVSLNTSHVVVYLHDLLLA